MARRTDPDYVYGRRIRPRDPLSPSKPPYRVSVPITHPPFCVCLPCAVLPIEERARSRVIRVRRKSPSPQSRVLSSAFALKVKAEEEEKLRRAADALLPVGVGLMTVARLLRLYLTEHRWRSESSRERAEIIIEQHLIPELGSALVDALKPLDFTRYSRKRVEEDHASPATVNREWNVLRAGINFGVTNELLERNPIRRGAVRPLAVADVSEEFFEPNEWRAFLGAFDDAERWTAYLEARRERKGIRLVGERPLGPGGRRPDSDASREYLGRLRELVPVFRALLYTAARLDELLSLRWRDVDLVRGLVTIHQRKTGKAKTLPLVAPLRVILGEAKRRVAAMPEAYVFTHESGRPFYEREVQRAFAVALEIAGITKQLTPHAIRDTVGSWLVIAGFSEEVHVAEILGHKRRTITSRYSHLTKRSLQPAMETLVRIEREGFTKDEVGAAESPAHRKVE
jgi:integrase